MATKTPIPPGPPPRGFQWPEHPPNGSSTPLGTGPTSSRTIVVQPGRHGITVFVGIVALVIGLIFGYQLGSGSDDGSDSAAAGPDTGGTPDSTDAPVVTTSTPTTAAPDGIEGPGALDPLGTLTNPIPVGQKWILGIFELEVVGVELDATDTVLAEDRRNPSPRDGMTYVLVEIELTLVDDLFVFADDFVPGLQTADGAVVDTGFQPCGPSVPDDFYGIGRLREAEPARGKVCFEVPSDATDGLLLTTDSFGDTITYFAVEPD